jgi:hypothetical protein
MPQKATTPITCVVCGQTKVVTPQHAKTQTHCSMACVRKTVYEPHRVDRVCQRCGTSFRCARWLYGKYCSAECSIAPPLPDIPPSESSLPIDLRSYLIGVFDGEGCITAGFNKNGGTYLIVSVTMCAEAVVRTFHRHYRSGNVGYRSQRTAGGLVLWYWQVTGATAIPLLEDLASVALVKRDQAILALALARNMARYARSRRDGFNPMLGRSLLTQDDRQQRVEIMQRIRALNGARNRFVTPIVDPLRQL